MSGIDPRTVSIITEDTLMKFLCTVAAAAALMGGVVAASAPAHARMADPGLRAPSAVENVACRVVRERVRRPNGAIVWRERTVCTPGYIPPVVRPPIVRPPIVRPVPRCYTERQRIVRPNGTVVFKTVRRCR